ncbi:fused (3R)-hydroxyacyl-ACP dehydratase subunits HadA/HadB [Williamsia sp. CHRR-6]|uniref:fused (3R)-hydroxyacyl-ACP dehydratase subunits HadA/HadB n=1 Tax=Williamsia sp. CHRR-6 TaxID=2835871 RepID=UPI001BDB045D|nr:fused (3R)-hydroxyacyl-ACP dehydratase subunits HadA/HadB [Williamsia sp. CHRR-6]MBT0565898.1 MaoC family dehydratase N-terminal domain-containing protein [Williamsia sp. CHRR-6]
MSVVEGSGSVTNVSESSYSSVEDRLAVMATEQKLTPEENAVRTAQMVGYHYTCADYYEVGREKIREYARAVQDGHPCHWNDSAAQANGHAGIIAPLTFVGIFGMLAQRRLFDEILQGYDVSQVLQADQRLVFHRPLAVGDRLVVEVSLDSFRRVADADMLVTKNQITDQHGDPVLTTWTTLVGKAGEDPSVEIMDMVRHTMLVEGASFDPGRTIPEHSGRFETPDSEVRPEHFGAVSFDSLTVGQELAPRTVRLTRGNLVNYAGVAGDPNPIHFSEEIAKAVGLENVVAHGMQTMGIAAGYISAFVGDPGAVFEYNVRFTSPVYVPADGYGRFELTGKVRSLDPQTRTGQIALVAKQDGRKIFGRALAHVQFS